MDRKCESVSSLAGKNVFFDFILPELSGHVRLSGPQIFRPDMSFSLFIEYEMVLTDHK